MEKLTFLENYLGCSMEGTVIGGPAWLEVSQWGKYAVIPEGGRGQWEWGGGDGVWLEITCWFIALDWRKKRAWRINPKILDYLVSWVKVWYAEMRNKSRVWWKMSSVVGILNLWWLSRIRDVQGVLKI